MVKMKLKKKLLGYDLYLKRIILKEYWDNLKYNLCLYRGSFYGGVSDFEWLGFLKVLSIILEVYVFIMYFYFIFSFC